MTPVPIVVTGAGGFGREVLDVIDSINRVHGRQYQVVGVVDDAPSYENLRRLDARAVPYLGGDEQWLAVRRPISFVVGIGNPRIRARVARSYRDAGFEPATLIHPSAVVGSQVTFGPGTVVCGGVQIATNVSVGEHVHLNAHSTVGHDAQLASFASVNPGAVLSGCVSVGEGALIGAGAIVLENLQIGRGSVVGAAACVVRDVPAMKTVKGVPAR